ncbi:FadR/GntR family transcriptional regulator [Protofrankia coriariae]|uniref:GntR family transcriptional regulator n=1 Tax=Protofrankia coriariae TaxID=1562887 RepID=A0ABR5F5J5_9ACTN|nr:FadR/GntR family transcriptional regulator [Protofrankia coriariae]KLL11967.1 GntR family transcriptional regulator [Protofrankia coriariae]
MAVQELAMPATSRAGTVVAIGQQVRVPKTAELVAAHLRRRIVRGELVEGDALPPEATLMEQFGVSRPTLREAFRVLESEALITVRRGAHGGARVHTPNGDIAARYAALVLEYRGTTLADIHQARAVIEPPCVALLAANRTQEDLDKLRLAVSETAAAVSSDDPGQYLQADLAFHVLLVELAGNTTLSVLSGMLRHILDLATLSHPNPERSAEQRLASRRRLLEHERVVDFIEARDARAAEELWRTHLLETSQDLTNGPVATTVLDLLG